MYIKSLFLLLGLCPAIWSMSETEMQQFIKISPDEYARQTISRYGDAIPYHLYLGFMQHVRCFEHIKATERNPQVIQDAAICFGRHVASVARVEFLFQACGCKEHIKKILNEHGLPEFSELCDWPDTPVPGWVTQWLATLLPAR